MIEQDTIKLLRECDAGVKMGISSIDEVLPHVESEKMKHLLHDCKDEHVVLEREINDALCRFHDEGKAPNPIAKGMSWMKTNMKLAVNESDATVASLITDGCNMGIKSLERYLNEYKAADKASQGIAKRLISSEEDLAIGLRSFL